MLGSPQNVWENSWMCVGSDLICEKILKKMRFLTTIGVTDATIRVKKKKFGKGKALRVIPRGKHWLTVYRATQVFLAKIERYTGSGHDTPFSRIVRSLDDFPSCSAR